MADSFGLDPLVKLRQPGSCPHTHTKWKRWKREERRSCLRCGMMLPRTAGIRHVQEVREGKAHAKRKAAFLAKRRAERREKMANASAALAEAVRKAADAINAFAAAWNAPEQRSDATPPL